MKFGGHKVTKSLFIENLDQKLKNKEFLGDMIPLLPRHKDRFVPETAYLCLREHLIEGL
jgi:hypothetical protein